MCGLNREKRRNFLRWFNTPAPKDVEGTDNIAVVYYSEKLIEKLYGILVWEGVPEWWDMEYTNRAIFVNGCCSVQDTDVGVIPLWSHASGINVFQKPNHTTATNPILGTVERTIDVDCVCFNPRGNYTGYMNLIRRYAYLLAQCDATSAVSLMNARASIIGRAGTKAGRASFFSMWEEVTEGNPAVCIGEDSDFSWTPLKAKENFISPESQMLKRTIIAEFLTEFGVQNTNVDKRERLNKDEVNSKSVELEANVNFMMYQLKDACNKINKMFDLNISVEHIKDKVKREEEQKNDTIQLS